MKNFLRSFSVVIGSLSFCAVVALADPTDGQIAKAVDQALPRLVIAEQELPEALAEMGRQAGVTITVDEASLDLLPWGRQTKVKTITAENTSLRDVLPQVLGRLGLAYETRDKDLFVVASEPLKRINRRATWEDLKLLRQLNDVTYSPENLAKFKLQFRISAKVDAPGLLQAQFARAGRGTIAQVLETATGALGWVWFPNGDTIAIRTVEAQIANRLSRRITVRYSNEPLSRILVDLADRAETAISFEPGMMLKLPPQVAQSTSLALTNASIKQGFELLTAETGIKYEARRTGLYVGLSEQVQAATETSGSAAAPTRPTGGYVGKISVPSGDGSYSFEILLRSDDLPEDVLEYRRQLVEQYIAKIRADMAPSGNAKHSPGGASDGQ